MWKTPPIRSSWSRQNNVQNKRTKLGDAIALQIWNYESLTDPLTGVGAIASKKYQRWCIIQQLEYPIAPPLCPPPSQKKY